MAWNSYLTTILCGACLFVIVCSPSFGFASLQNCQSFHSTLLSVFFCPAHSLTPDRVFTPFFPSFLFFIRFFLSCSSVFAIEYAIGSRASICLSQKRNFWAKCQLCTLNIYRKAIYVIAWFSSTNIHALENCLISGSIFPSILCIIRSYFSSIANWWFDLLCVCACTCIHNLLLYCINRRLFFHPLFLAAAAMLQINWLFVLAKYFVRILQQSNFHHFAFVVA